MERKLREIGGENRREGLVFGSYWICVFGYLF